MPDSAASAVTLNPGLRDRTATRGSLMLPTPLVLAIGFALVVLAGIAAVYMSMRTDDAGRWVAHTFIVRDEAARLLIAVQDAETGQRGYLLTGSDAALEPYVAATRTAPGELAELRRLTLDNSVQQKRLDRLDHLVAARFATIATIIALARAGNRGAAIDNVTHGPGNAQMNAIRAELSAFSDMELDLLTKRQAALAALQDWMRILICVSLAAALALAALLARSMFATMERLKARSLELEAEMRLRQQAEGTLRQAQKMEAVGQLSGGIAHDFNNLLTIILGNLDTIKRRVTAATSAQGALDLAGAINRPLDAALYGTHKSAELVHRLLAFSRRQMLEPVRVDLNRLVADLTDMLHRTLGENIDIETILGVGLWPTFADANQVENALVNLCVNARDAMAEGGRLTIETANTYLDDAYARQFGDVAPGQYVLLSVTDTGTGIASENLARMFEPFFTTKPTGQGTGLGLAMVHGFVKQSGGHIRIYSEVGSGTTVKIYLPRLTETERVSMAPAAKPADDSAMPRAHDGEKILIVEDNDGVRQYAATVLRDLGYTVTEANDATSALRAFEADGAIDLLFTDVILPGTTGRVLAEEILKRRPDLPVLFTTGYSRNAIIHHGRLDADVQLLGKPYTQIALARKVRELLDKG